MLRRPPGGGIVAAVIIFAAALCGCGRSQNADKAPAAASVSAVAVAAAALKSVTPAGTFVGRVQAVNTVNLVSRVEGFLQKRAFTEGQQVKTGDLLFVIEQGASRASRAAPIDNPATLAPSPSLALVTAGLKAIG